MAFMPIMSTCKLLTTPVCSLADTLWHIALKRGSGTTKSLLLAFQKL